jgi:hypothetical protein
MGMPPLHIQLPIELDGDFFLSWDGVGWAHVLDLFKLNHNRDYIVNPKPMRALTSVDGIDFQVHASRHRVFVPILYHRRSTHAYVSTVFMGNSSLRKPAVTFGVL